MPDAEFDFSTGGVRHEDPETSREAAVRVPVERLEQYVLGAIKRLGGQATSEEVAALLGIDLQSITPRMAPLKRKALIQDSHHRRRGRRGRDRVVWELTEFPW
jgi:predicted ArsR family transcriptional regulator